MYKRMEEKAQNILHSQEHVGWNMQPSPLDGIKTYTLKQVSFNTMYQTKICITSNLKLSFKLTLIRNKKSYFSLNLLQCFICAWCNPHLKTLKHEYLYKIC